MTSEDGIRAVGKKPQLLGSGEADGDVAFARLDGVAAALLGCTDSDGALRDVRYGAGAGRSSCPCCCLRM